MLPRTLTRPRNRSSLAGVTTTLERVGLQTKWPSRPATPLPPRPGPFRLFGELPFLLAIAFVFALISKTLLVQAFFIPSESMVPTLLVKDRVIVNKLVYRFREPRRGEVIVFIAHPDERERSTFDKLRSFFTEGLGVTMPAETDYIKRVIGLPGETIEVTESEVRITTTEGVRLVLDEPYIQLEGRNLSLQDPFVVPEGFVFMMGDNRNNSSDSRSSLGPVPIDRIIGKAFVKVWPVQRIGLIGTPTYGSSVEATADGGDVLGRVIAGPPLALLAVGMIARRRRMAA